MELLRDEGIGGVIEAVPAGGPGNVLPMTGRDGGLRSSNTATEYQVRDTPPSVPPSIDWLTVAQVHDSAPLVGSALLVFVDPQSGEIESQAVKGLTFEGSYDSRLMIRSDGRRVEVSGNPSRFGRRDNVFGRVSVNECIELYNGILKLHGLPEFYLDDRTELGGHQLQRSEAIAEHGCRIKRIDLCEVYEVGNIEDARASIRALSSVSHAGKPGFCYPDGNTVSWGQGSRYSYFKYYLKGPEMVKHLDQSDPYCKALTDWAVSRGIVRHEVSLKSMFLARNGLDQPARWTVEAASNVMKTYRTHDRAGLGASSYDTIAKELVAQGVTRSRAQRAQMAAYSYLAGHQFVIGMNISRASYFRLQADLRKVGINIGAPLNVAALRHTVRVVEWRSAVPPLFYERAS